MRNIKIGIEVECVFNNRLFRIERGNYHEGLNVKGLPSWTAENDGSLRTEREFDSWAETGEFVSRCFESKKDLFKGLNEFIKFFSKSGKYELSQVLSFNSSCGSHVHFSIGDFEFGKKCVFEVFPRVRDYFIKRLSSSKIKSWNKILNHYGRHYAEKINKNNWKDDRYREFNFESEQQGHGIEWRSLNMLNLQTWAEFLEFWNIVYDSLEFFGKIATKYEEEWEEEIISIDEINDIERTIKHKKDLLELPNYIEKPRARRVKWIVENIKIDGIESEVTENIIQDKLEETESCVI